MRAPSVIWEAAGRPDPRRKSAPASGQCYWCAAAIDVACRVDDVISDSFTDQDQALVRASPLLCRGCAWSMTGRPPDTLRLWSIGYREDGAPWPANHSAAKDLGPRIHAQNKADPSAFRALLREPPSTGAWVCSIADSGQIHTLPFAPVNGPGARYGVRYERSTIWTSAAEYRQIDDAIRELMTAGFSKDDIAGTPSPYRLTGATIEVWRRLQPALTPYRGGPLLDLALFLARKDKTDGDDRTTERVGDPIRNRDPVVDRRGEGEAPRLAGPDRGGAGGGGSVQRSLFGDDLDGGAQDPGGAAPGAHRKRATRPRG